jgi:ectoine hydroxylase-related dioxygenase (phytanoyl-CoA dioxygenase family)
MAAGQEFEQAMLNPVLLTLVRYLLGDEFVLSSAIGSLKGPGDFPLFLHSDQVIHPSPRSLVCNVHYLLSDYSKENGATCFVPGSHKLMRQPTASENFRFEKPLSEAPNNGLFGSQFEAQARRRAGEALEIVEPPKVVPIEAPKGSLLIWHGNTWHGSFPRSNPGLRANFSMLFCNIWLRPHEAYLECLPQEVLDRNGDRFADLIGRNVSVGYTSEGPDYKPGGVFENTRKRVNANAFDA